MLGQVEAGTLRPLAVTTPERLARWPQVPTEAKSSCPGFEASDWCGVAVPAHTPAEGVAAVVAAVAEGAQAAMDDASLRRTLPARPGQFGSASSAKAMRACTARAVRTAC